MSNPNPVLPPPGIGPVPHESLASRIGGWLPNNPRRIQEHVKKLVSRAKEHQLPLVPPVVALRVLMDTTPAVRMLFTEMLTEVPAKYTDDPLGPCHSEIRDVDTLIITINQQIQEPIRFDTSEQIGTPINAILDWPMGTKAGFAAFLREDVNLVFAAILKYWGIFLAKNPESVATVTTAEGGWLSPQAQTQEVGLQNFLATYDVPDKDDKLHYGFTSWDQFFTRRFLPGRRPLPSPEDPDVIVSAAESTPFYIQHNVQLRDTFWAKNQDWRTNYSLVDMLGSLEVAKLFEGGTVYQAFLSADSYHNWHAPVAGRWHPNYQPKILPGAYYSESLMWGFSPDDDIQTPNPDPGADARSQSYISAVARRGVGVIEADNPAIGLVGVVMIGMAEVSSIEFDKLDHFDKGQMIGRFHFGGSSHCLIFRKGVNIKFEDQAQYSPDITHLGKIVHVCSAIATVQA